MSTNVTVSEGVPVDGRIFQPPEINRDNEKPRYIAFLGSLIDADIARSRPWTKGGGLEITNPCLRYVKNFIRKGRITPLLRDTHDFQRYDYIKKMTDVDPLSAGYFPQPIPQGYVPPALPAAAGDHHHGFGELAVGGPSPYGSLIGRLALPGEQITAVLTGAENLTQTNIQRGVVELTDLKGMDYRPQMVGNGIYVDPTIWEIQKTIFPDYPVFLDQDGNPTVLLDEIERSLDNAADNTSLRSMVDQFHESLIQFRDYASATVQNVHDTMRESASRGGYVWRYTAMDLVLLEQLGMERQDRTIRQSTSKTSKMEELFEQFLQMQIEEKQANMEREQRVSPIVNQNTMAAAPIAEPVQDTDRLVPKIETTPVQHVCECEKSFSTQKGLVLHKAQHCPLKKTVESESTATEG